MDIPDLIDIVRDWVQEHHPQLHLEVLVGGCTDNKAIVIHRVDPHRLLTLGHLNDRERGLVYDRNYLFTLSLTGTLWRHYVDESRNIDMTINPADPNAFNILNDVIIRRLNADR